MTQTDLVTKAKIVARLKSRVSIGTADDTVYCPLSKNKAFSIKKTFKEIVYCFIRIQSGTFLTSNVCWRGEALAEPSQRKNGESK